MTEQVTYEDVKPGAELAPVSYPVMRLSLVKYCGASGDFNVIHWNERIARSVGLPNVIAHGMFTMAERSSTTTRSCWCSPPGPAGRRCSPAPGPSCASPEGAALTLCRRPAYGATVGPRRSQRPRPGSAVTCPSCRTICPRLTVNRGHPKTSRPS